MRNRLYFNHIPRTAGTTVRSWLASFIPPHLVCPYLHPHEFRQASEMELRGYSFFSGHLLELPVEMFGHEIATVTVLREPRSHLASIITYNAQTKFCPVNATSQLIRDKSKELLHTHIDKSYAASWAAVNLQTKWLINRDPTKRYTATAADLQAAIGVLGTALAVGTLDRLQDFADLVCYKMRWPRRPLDERLNASPSENLLDEIDAQYLDVLLEPDLRLYQHAQHLLDSELEKCFGANADSDQRATALEQRAAMQPK